MPLRAMRIPQGVFGVRWGKNITHALSKKTRLIILRQKLKKLLAFQKGYFFGTPCIFILDVYFLSVAVCCSTNTLTNLIFQVYLLGTF